MHIHKRQSGSYYTQERIGIMHPTVSYSRRKPQTLKYHLKQNTRDVHIVWSKRIITRVLALIPFCLPFDFLFFFFLLFLSFLEILAWLKRIRRILWNGIRGKKKMGNFDFLHTCDSYSTLYLRI